MSVCSIHMDEKTIRSDSLAGMSVYRVAVIEMPLPVRDYLAKVLPGLADDSIQRNPLCLATQHALAQALHDTNLKYIHMGPLRRISRNSSTVYLL